MENISSGVHRDEEGKENRTRLPLGSPTDREEEQEWIDLRKVELNSHPVATKGREITVRLEDVLEKIIGSMGKNMPNVDES